MAQIETIADQVGRSGSCLAALDGWVAVAARREDRAFRFLVREASAELGRSTLRASATSSVRRPPCWYALGMATLAVAMLALRIGLASADERPAHVRDTATLVETDQPSAVDGRFLLAMVAIAPLDPDAARVRMASSIENALTAAARCAGLGTERAAGIAIDANGVSGASAGLMFALTVADGGCYEPSS